jgi:hypothetical protein
MPSKRPLGYLLAVFIILGLVAGCYWAFLFFSFDKLEAGVREQDVVTLAKYIDWPAIRDQLRSEIRGTALRRFYENAMGKQETPGYFLGALLAGTIAPAMVDQFVDSFVTPQGFVDLLGKKSGDRGQEIAITRIGLTDFDEYAIELGAMSVDPSKRIRAVLRRQGIIWRVVRVGFPPGEAPWEAVGPPGAGLKIEKLAPARTPSGLMIEGDILNTGNTPRDVPRLRVALRDAGQKEVQFKIVDAPTARLAPGAVAHFKTPFERPDDTATGVVVTFAPH